MHMHHHNTGGIAIDSYACNSRLRHISAGFKAGFSMLLLLFCIFADHPVPLCHVCRHSESVFSDAESVRCRKLHVPNDTFHTVTRTFLGSP